MSELVIDNFYGRRGPGWEGRLEGVMGIQGGGTIDGRRWWFRGWWGLWQVLIAEPDGADPARVGRGVPGWSASGTWSEPVMLMDANSAWSFVTSTFEAFRAGTLPRVAADAITRRTG